jgi:hypothetical protein
VSPPNERPALTKADAVALGVDRRGLDDSALP